MKMGAATDGGHPRTSRGRRIQPGRVTTSHGPNHTEDACMTRNPEPGKAPDNEPQSTPGNTPDMNRAVNSGPTPAATQEQRTADHPRLRARESPTGPGVHDYDPQIYADFMRVAEWRAATASSCASEDAERRKNDPTGRAWAQRRLRSTQAKQPPPKTKFKLVPFEDIRFVASEEWLIKKLVPQQGVAVLFGLPKAFKSFVAMDLALHVALGWDWAGRATTQGDVVYIAAENARRDTQAQGRLRAGARREPAGPRAVLSGRGCPEPRHGEKRSRRADRLGRGGRRQRRA